MAASRSLLVLSPLVIAAVGIWGVVDADSTVAVGSEVVTQFFESRGWFVMLTVSGMLLLCLYLAISPYGHIRLATG